MKYRQFVLFVFMERGSYIQVGSFSRYDVAKGKAKRLVYSGAKIKGDKITIGVWDSSLDWENLNAWNHFTWQD